MRRSLRQVAAKKEHSAKAVETSQVLNENLSEVTGTAGRLSKGRRILFSWNILNALHLEGA